MGKYVFSNSSLGEGSLGSLFLFTTSCLINFLSRKSLITLSYLNDVLVSLSTVCVLCHDTPVPIHLCIISQKIEIGITTEFWLNEY